MIVSAGGLAVGEVDHDALEGRAGDADLLDILGPVPTTVRPSVTVASVAAAGGGQRLVTASDGRLLGRATVEEANSGHEGHEGHQHDASSLGMERYESELTEVMHAVEERFGDREPPPEELRAFLHDRLVAEGWTAEEADRYLDDLEVGEAD